MEASSNRYGKPGRANIMKCCSKCAQEKENVFFYKNKAKPDGLQTYCKSCQSSAIRATPCFTRGTLSHFKYTRWLCINARTINGAYPNRKNKRIKGYFDKGIRIEMTKDEWHAFCDENEKVIMDFYAAGETPSIDRIDDKGHYSLGNIQIISRKENCRKGGQTCARTL